MELPKHDSEGAPAGVNDATDDPGGAAGVVDGLSPIKEYVIPSSAARLPGVDGAGLESGTMNRDAILLYDSGCLRSFRRF